MSLTIEKANESFLRIFTDSISLEESIYEYFSFHPENYRFMPNFKNGSWDGKIYLFNKSFKTLPIGLYSILITFLEKNNISYDYNNEIITKFKIEKSEISQFLLESNLKILLWDYQLKALQLSLIENKSIIQLPTGSGKSYLIFLYVKYLINKVLQDNEKILIVVPLISTIHQFIKEFENYESGYKEKVFPITPGKPKLSNKQIHISCWQSLYRLNFEYFLQFKGLIVDECHTAKAKSLKTICENCINASFRLGTTATIENDNQKLIFKGNFSNIFKIEKTDNLIKRDILSPLKIYHIVMKHPLETRIQVNLLAKRNIGNEIKIALSNKKRYQVILDIISNLNKNTLVLFRLKRFGKNLYERLKEISNKTIYYIDGDIKPLLREEIREKIELENNVILLATSQLFSMAVNLKNLHYLVITTFNKKKNPVMQTIGRGLRKHDSKTQLKVIDFVDDMKLSRKEVREYEKENAGITLTENRNLLLQHFYERLKYYDEENFEYKIKKIDL